MKIKNVLEDLQPNIYNKLKDMCKKEHISFSYTKELMRHSSYKRHNGALRQRGR